MDLIPIEPDDDLESFFDSLCDFSFSFVGINHPGDYYNENIIFKANEDIDSLYEYILIYSIEDEKTGLPVYSKCRLLTFDGIELQKGAFLQVFTCQGEDTTAIGFDTSAVYKVIYWGLTEPIWDKAHASFEIIKRGDSYSSGPSN